MPDRIKFSLLVHGPASAFTETVLRRARSAYRQGLVAEVVFSTYKGFEPSITFPELQIIENDDAEFSGFGNINRHSKLVLSGLSAIATQGLVIKLRSDQTINFRILALLIAFKNSLIKRNKILTTDCFTRTDRLFHPSDMFMVASKTALQKYFSLEPSRENHLDGQLRMAADYSSGLLSEIDLLSEWPESKLFLNYLKLNGESFPLTAQGSEAALNKYISLVPASAIGLRWEKFYLGRLPMVPYKFDMEPFPGGPFERCRCVENFKSPGLNNLNDLIRFSLWHPYLDLIRNWKPGNAKRFIVGFTFWARGFFANPVINTKNLFSRLVELLSGKDR